MRQPTHLQRVFGFNVRRLRLELRMSQRQLGEEIGASRQWICRIEQGYSSPSFDMLEKLAFALEAEYDELFLWDASCDQESFLLRGMRCTGHKRLSGRASLGLRR